jgi:hypothetical protein
MTDQMEWESPPPAGSFDWYAVADDLRAHPGQWLKIFDDRSIAIVNAIRQAEIRALRPVHRRGQPGFGFEVMTRNNKAGPPRVCSMYLRWVPEGSG